MKFAGVVFGDNTVRPGLLVSPRRSHRHIPRLQPIETLNPSMLQRATGYEEGDVMDIANTPAQNTYHRELKDPTESVC